MACVISQGLLHSIGHSSSGKLATAGAVTLHLYAPPIRRATLFEIEENRVVMRVPGFHSVDGQARGKTGTSFPPGRNTCMYTATSPQSPAMPPRLLARVRRR